MGNGPHSLRNLCSNFGLFTEKCFLSGVCRMALSDAEVEKQINHMKKFIQQEAREKAEEIQIKAEEEFNIEKGRLLQAEKRKVANYFERKEKHLELQRKIQHSNQLNQGRLTVLKARDDHVKHLLEDARSRLGRVTEDAGRYKKMLQDLIIQSLFQLLEPKVVVQCRKCDLTVVKGVIPAVREAYSNETKKKCDIVVDEENFLPSDSAGGVQVSAEEGKIKVVNTLESRLELLGGQMLPEIRTMLFGANPSRHFMD